MNNQRYYDRLVDKLTRRLKAVGQRVIGSTSHLVITLSFCIFIFTFYIFPVFAGGPFIVSDVDSGDGNTAVPSTWDASSLSPIQLNPEAGTCASFSNAQMITKLTNNVGEWTSVSGVDLGFNVDTTSASAITVDVTGAPTGSNSYTNWYTSSSGSAGFNDGVNPIFFDNDGTIIDAIFGGGSRFTTLGGAGPDSFNADGTVIIGGQGIFNCRCLPGNPNGSCLNGNVEFTEDDLNFTMTHEVGHMIGLDHTQVNQAIADAAISEASSGGIDIADACADGVTVSGSTKDCDDIPAMYPQSIDPATQLVPTRDDEVILLTLYGSSGWDSSLCKMTGTLTDADGNSLRCADVHAETDDPADTIAFISGALAIASDGNNDSYTDAEGECEAGCGYFILHGLDPAKSYTITVNPIDQAWIGASSISPCGSDPADGGTGQLTTIVEETIGSSTSCTSGGTITMGAVTTTSTGGVGSTGDDDDGSSGTGSSCVLNASTSSISWPAAVIWLSLFYGLLGITRQQFLENRRPIR